MPNLDTVLKVFLLLVLLGEVAILLLLGSLRSYATEKGKNLATKEDIGAITHEVEQVHAEYRERFEGLAQQNRILLEHTRQRHELRVAALDRRLAAHQEAYALWWKLIGSVHKEKEIGTVVVACQDWWICNRLYLEHEVAQAFSVAYHAAFSHRDYLRGSPDRPEIKDNWDKMMSVGEVIVKAVQLPRLHEGEYQPLHENETQKGGESARKPV